MSEAPLVRVEHLARYYGATCAVKDVSFSVKRGEVLGFLGPNGAGKTTTMQVLTGNLAPTRGRVSIAGKDILDDPKQAKAALGYLPEHPPLYRELTVDEYLTYCARLNGIPGREIPAARDQAKKRCGLNGTGRHLIANLSKGYQQRVGLAQAIIHRPPVIVLDEPTVGLDPLQVREIRALIRELGDEHSVILSTHILSEVQAACNRVQIIHRGELVLSDTIEGLATRMQASNLVIALRRPPTPEALRDIPGVIAVEGLPDGRLRLHVDPRHSPAEELVRYAVEQNWGLYELVPQRLSLEEVFVEITRGERDVAPTAETPVPAAPPVIEALP